MATIHVQGRCPSCLQETLTLDGDHHVRCDNEECPAPDVVVRILEAAL